MEENETEPVWAVLKRAFWGAVLFVGHLPLLLIVIGGIRGFEWILTKLLHVEEVKFWDCLPLSWICDAGDVGMLGLFIISGLRDANRQLRRR